MSDVSKVPGPAAVRRQRSIYQVHYGIRRREEMTAVPLAAAAPPPPPPPPASRLHVQAYKLQVAGHKDTHDTKYLGLLQCNNGTILKPILKESQKREVDFYNRLTTSTDPDLMELRKCTCKYYGCKQFTYNGFELEYIILEDLTERMLEPCIMDVKIGRRTWDPLATEEKIRKEQSKYAQCKQEFAFCIPGFQVFRLATGKLHKYNKDYGKKLHGHMVRDAIRNYLNGVGSSLCRALVLQLLSQLWRIQKWARRQRALRASAASLLLVYDAAKLRASLGAGLPGAGLPGAGLPGAGLPGAEPDPPSKCRPTRRKSIHSMHSDAGSNFSGQISSKGPVYKKLTSVPLTPMTVAQASFTTPPPITSSWTEALERLNHNHSFDHNYEDKLSKIKMNYRALLDQLSYDSPTPNPWGTVKIIDFAHAFFNEEENREVDDNFREGIDNFVQIFEGFLNETNDQVI